MPALESEVISGLHQNVKSSTIRSFLGSQERVRKGGNLGNMAMVRTNARLYACGTLFAIVRKGNEPGDDRAG